MYWGILVYLLLYFSVYKMPITEMLPVTTEPVQESLQGTEVLLPPGTFNYSKKNYN